MSKPIISLIVILFSLGFAFLYVKPEFDFMQGHRADVERLNDIIKDADSIKTLIGATQETLDSVSSVDRARFETFLPETADPIRFANNLQYIGFRNGLVLENIKVDESANSSQKSAGGVAVSSLQGAVQGAVNIFTIGRKAELSQAAYEASTANANIGTDTSVTDKKYITTKASFALVANLETFRLFLNDLEKSLRLINISELSFSPEQTSSDVKKTEVVGPPLYRYVVTIEAYSLK